jgi:hypothetical protein
MSRIIPFLSLELMKEAELGGFKRSPPNPFMDPGLDGFELIGGPEPEPTYMFEPEKRVQKKVTRTEIKLRRRARKAMTRKSRRTNRR